MQIPGEGGGGGRRSKPGPRSSWSIEGGKVGPKNGLHTSTIEVYGEVGGGCVHLRLVELN